MFLTNEINKYQPKNYVQEQVLSTYPGAVTNGELTQTVKEKLSNNGLNEQSTLLATSLCCDEVNRVLELDLGQVYGAHFSMGGLAGFPFGGVTAFTAMAHHIPDGGSCLVVYGPHVGIDNDGNVGMLNRVGRKASGACCGSAAAAAGYVRSCSGKEVEEGGGATASASASTTPTMMDVMDAQQSFVGSLLLPYADRLEGDLKEAAVELPLALFDAQDKMMKNIVSQACGEVAGENGKIALLGGVQINTPGDDNSDYFLPLSFELRSNKNEILANLLG